FRKYWHNLFKMPIDNMPNNFRNVIERIRKYFFECKWYEVYDFIEFTAQNCPDELKEDFIEFINSLLEKELSAYRFVDEQLTDITDEQEIESIETAINSSNKFSGTKIHLKAALSLLTDRKKPDYRNSVKESISAVEALCVVLSGDPKATLGASLNSIEKSHSLHPAFKKALANLYGFTSDSDGIRHALLDEPNITYSDAKYMLVSCSAFINYVLGKISEN
ncbi:AbiJ-NTD4 domain-containing protein, partial [Acinetobacter baumannii]